MGIIMNSINDLNKIKLFVLDMDGTFYLGDSIISGSLDFLKKVEELGREFIFFTNNSSKNSESYRLKLQKLGCNVTSDRVITSGDVTINYLKKNYASKKVYLLGTKFLEDSFKSSEILLVDDKPDIVVVGFDTDLTYEKIYKACTFIRQGSIFLATHLDLNCPTEDGFLPDCGAMCAMITAATGIKPIFMGKPFKETIDYVLDYTGYKKEEITFVGDRLYTDIAIGVYNGVTSILVLSGETKLEDLETSDIKPDYIFDSLLHISESI